MAFKIGSVVSFTSPTENANLKGQIVLKKPASEIFKEYTEHEHRYNPTDTIYSIRVWEVLQKHKQDYKTPAICKIPEEKINTVLVKSDDALDYNQQVVHLDE